MVGESIGQTLEAFARARIREHPRQLQPTGWRDVDDEPLTRRAPHHGKHRP